MNIELTHHEIYTLIRSFEQNEDFKLHMKEFYNGLSQRLNDKCWSYWDFIIKFI